MALRAEIVDLVGLDLLDDANQVGGIGEVAVVQDEAPILFVGILVKMIDALGVEKRCAAFYAMNGVSATQ